MNRTIFSFVFVTITAISLFLVVNSIYILDQRQSSLVLQFGEPMRQELTPGLKFKIPFIQNVLFFDKKIKNAVFLPSDATSEVMASDQKTMKLTAYAKYRISNPLRFYQTVQRDEIFKRRMSSIMESAIREAIGSVLFVEFLDVKRREVSERIIAILHEQTKGFGIDILDVRIIQVNLPNKAKNAVYARMRTDREKEAKEIRALGMEEAKKIKAGADRAKVIMLAESRKKADILKGDGEAEAVRIAANAFGKDLEFFTFYKTMQAYKTSLQKDSTTFVFSSQESDFLKYLTNGNAQETVK